MFACEQANITVLAPTRKPLAGVVARSDHRIDPRGSNAGKNAALATHGAATDAPGLAPLRFYKSDCTLL